MFNPMTGKRNAEDKPVFAISVRELVEFCLRTGDLGGDRDFMSPSRALEGTRGHQRLQRSRPEGYQAEVTVSKELDCGSHILRVQGRIDGIWRREDRTIVEEIKTVLEFPDAGEATLWDRIEANLNPNCLPQWLHVAQARVYAWLFADQEKLETLSIQLTYLEIQSGAVREFRQDYTALALKDFFEDLCETYTDWIGRYHQWRLDRDKTIRQTAFPFGRYRPGQRELAVAAYKTLKKGARLFAEAPTGIGKTVSVLFPAIKALEKGEIEKIFYLTAKTVGRTVAEKAITDLRRAGLRIRSITLTAKEKICFNQGQPCDVRECLFAKGYYDRNRLAVEEVLSRETATREVIEEAGRKHRVCPSELALDAALWMEVVICDYNYVFDPSAYIRRFFAADKNDYAFLIDEAHNLPDRAREMYSADLSKDRVLEARRLIPKSLAGCRQAFNRIHQFFLRYPTPLSSGERVAAGRVRGDPDGEEPDRDVKKPPEASVRREPPKDLLPLLQQFLWEAERWLEQNRPADFRADLIAFYFEVMGFLRTADLYDGNFVTLFIPEAGWRLRLFCLDPSTVLAASLQKAKGTIFFSATLSPLDYYRSLLGGGAGDGVLQLLSPFPPGNLSVMIHDRIRTDYAARAGSYEAVAMAAAAAVRGRKGNYILYFPSYDYLQAVAERFEGVYREGTILRQKPGMTEAERESFLGMFHTEHDQSVVGFAVMGGIFGEGIDLVGERLIGVVVVGVGLPQICLERNLMKALYSEKNLSGFDYAYLYPGMNRVLQSVGRLIRSETDRGMVLLIDARFAEARHARLFPAWWTPLFVRSEGDIARNLEEFWGRT
jgi:DNA excision repair protein ERCC-2